MSQEEIRQRWAKYNLLGEGKDRSAYGPVWYRGDTMFNLKRPGARIIKNHKGKFVALSNGEIHPGMGTGPDKKSGQLFHASHYVACIGVFSQYEGDSMGVPQLHERLNFLFNREFAQELADYREARPADFAENPDFWIRKVMEALSRINNRRLEYSSSFGLNWTSYQPDKWRPQVTEFFITGAQLYNMPSAVAKRERAAARRTAKKAFGVE